MSEAERVLKCGVQVTLLGRDIVSAFNHVKKGVVHKIRMKNDTQGLAECVQNFLLTSTCSSQWHSTIGITGSITNGTPLVCPLSPVLCLIDIATTLKQIDAWILESHGVCPSLQNPNTGATTNRVLLHSHVDDIDPMIITSRTSKYHQETKRLVIEIMDDEAAKGELHWHT